MIPPSRMDENLWDENLSAHDEGGALMNIARAHRRKLESKNKCNCCRGRDQRHWAVPLNHDVSIVVVLSLTVGIATMGGACADEIVESWQQQPRMDVIAPIWGKDVPKLPKKEGEFMPGVAVQPFSIHVDGQLQLAQRKIFRGRTLMMMSVPMKTSGLGDGLVALLVLYIFLLLSCFIGCNIRDGWKLYVPFFFVVLIITLVLVLAPKWPREKLDEKISEDATRVLDTRFIPQVLIMTAVWVGAVAGIVICLIFHWAHPVHARALDD